MSESPPAKTSKSNVDARHSVHPLSVVTLVHGTWARDASWAHSDSTLCRGLRSALPDIVFERFEWSGKNSHRARLEAAHALTDQIRTTMSRFPTARHSVVGHSHGGNVALYALRDPDIAVHLSSIVCLATPFIHASARPVEPALRMVRWLIYSFAIGLPLMIATLSLVFLSLAVIVYPEGDLAIQIRQIGLPTSLQIPLVAALQVAVVWAAVKVARRVRRSVDTFLRSRIEDYQRRLIERYEPSAPRPVPVLNVQVDRDEAAWWLRALLRASESPAAATTVVPFAAALATLVPTLFLWNEFKTGLLDASSPEIAIAVCLAVGLWSIGWIMFLAMGIVMSHLMYISMPLLFRAHGLGFGEWSLIANWLVQIEARPAPPPGYASETITISVGGKGLHHSQVYEDSVANQRLIDWLVRPVGHARA